MLGGIQHRPQMWEKQLCGCKMSSCDVGARAALAGADGWKRKPLPSPFSHPPVKPGLGSTDNLQKREVHAVVWRACRAGVQPGSFTGRLVFCRAGLQVGSPSRRDHGNLHLGSLLSLRVYLAVVGLTPSESVQVFPSHSWHMLLPWALAKKESKSQILLRPSVHLLSFQLVCT